MAKKVNSDAKSLDLEKGYMYVVFLVDHVALRFIIFYVWGKGNPVHTLS